MTPPAVGAVVTPFTALDGVAASKLPRSEQLRDIPFIAMTLRYLADPDPLLAEVALAEAVERALREPQVPVAQCSGPGSFEDEVWTRLMRYLAAARPELFGPGLSELSPQARGPSYAFLLETTRRGQFVHRVPKDDPLVRAMDPRTLAQRWLRRIGLPKVEPGVEVWRAMKGTALDSYLSAHIWSGVSLYCEPSLRHVVFAREQGAWGDGETASAIRRLSLHEYIHASLAQLAKPGEVVELSGLKMVLVEAVVEALTRLAAAARTWPDGYLSPPFTGWTFDDPNAYHRLVLGLLDIASAGGEFMSGGWLVQLGVEALEAEDDNELVELLQAFSNGTMQWEDPWSWFHHFTAEQTPLRVRYDDSEEWTRGIDRHRTDGPAIVYDEGRAEYWVEGLLHRLDGPAIVDPKNGDERWVWGLRLD